MAEKYITKALSDIFFPPLPGMQTACLVSVLIPVYNESVNTLLYSLSSLARQTSVQPEQYEVIMVISNTRRSAINKVKEFKQNKKTLKFLDFLIKKQSKSPFKINKKQLTAITVIRSAGLIVHALDMSSLPFASEFDSVGAARDRGGAVICQRFLSVPVGRKGIIAMTDCDCRVSPNYIAELIGVFAKPSINGVAGKWFTEIDPALPYKKLVEMGVAIHFGADHSYKKAQQGKRLPLLFQKKDSLKKIILTNGQNMAVTVRAWTGAGGVPHYSSFEDIIFGRRVTSLPGDTVYDPNFYVVTLARISERVGVMGFGRRVKHIVESISLKMKGRHFEISIPHRQQALGFLADIFALREHGLLTEERIWELFAKWNISEESISQTHIKTLAELGSKGRHDNNGKNFQEFEQYMLKYIYPFLPTEKV